MIGRAAYRTRHFRRELLLTDELAESSTAPARTWRRTRPPGRSSRSASRVTRIRTWPYRATDAPRQGAGTRS